MTVRKVGIIFANNWVKVTKPSRVQFICLGTHS
jgi:hypothetical protein